MKKRMTLWKRIGALLMAVVLVAGVCPVPAFAAADDTADTVNEFKLELQRVDMQGMWDNSKDPDSKAWNTELWGPRPEIRPASKYTYIAEVPNAKKENVRFFWWKNPDGRETGDLYIEDENRYEVGKNVRCIYESDEAISISAKVICDGLTLINTLKSDMTKADPTTWGGATDKEGFAPKLGVPFTLGKFIPDGVSGYDGAQEVVILDSVIDTTKVMEETPAVDASGEGKKTRAAAAPVQYIPTSITTESELIKREVYVNGALRYVEKLRAAVTYPTYNATFTIDGKDYKSGETAYLTAARDVTITIPMSDDVQGITSLPNGYTWTETANKDGWTTTVPAVPGELTVGEDKLTVVVDGTAPTISNADAYQNGENTVVSFTHTVGVSGLKNVIIDGASIDISDEKIKIDGEKITVTVASVSNPVTVQLTSNAGLSSDVAVDVKDDLIISFETNNDMGETFLEGDICYVTQKGSVTVTVTGATPGPGSDPELETLTKDTVDILNDLQNGSVGYTMDGETMPSFTIAAVDSLGRTKEAKSPTYKLDTAPPSVKWGGLENSPDKIYVGSEKTYQVVIQDDTLKEATVTYIISGQPDKEAVIQRNGNQCTAEIPVKNGETLEKVTVHAEDQLKHTYDNTITPNIVVDTKAPEITLTFNEVVKGFFKTGDGTPDEKYFAILDPVTDVDEGDETTKVTVTAKASIRDANMDAAALVSAGWTEDSANKTFTKTFDAVVVQKHETGTLHIVIPAQDLAGNNSEPVTISAGAGDTGTILTLKPKDGMIVADIGLDRRLPSSGEDLMPPEVKMIPSVTGISLDDKGTMLYKENFSFNVTVTDVSAGGADSGVAEVTWKLTGDTGNFLTVQEETQNGAGTYTIPVTVGTGETDNAVLEIYVKDKADNCYTYTHTFAVDNKAPVVNVTKSADKANTIGTTDYYADDFDYTVTVTDLFLETATVSVNGETPVNLTSGNAYSFTVDDELNSIEIVNKDQTGHSSALIDSFKVDEQNAEKLIYNGNKVIVDKVAPKISVTVSNNPVVKGTGGNNDYYSEELTYNIQVIDANMADEKGNLTISYTIDGTTTTVSLPAKEGGITAIERGYGYSFTVKDGQTLSAWSVTATDDAKKESSKNMTGNAVVVDTTAPEVTVEKSIKEPTNTVNGVDYYNAPVEYTVTVKDQFINANSDAIQVTVTPSGTFLSEKEIQWTNNGTQRIGRFTVENQEELKKIEITVTDAAGNPVKNILGDAATFAESNGTFTSQKLDVVVDTTQPVATLKITGEPDILEGYYNRADGKLYLQLKDTDKNDKLTVYATLTVSDYNLPVGSTDGTFIKNNSGGEKWVITGGVNNKDSVAVLEKNPLTVMKNATGSLVLDVDVRDLANNPMAIQFASINETVPGDKQYTLADGKFKIDVKLDFRAPTSGADTDVPVITVAPAAPFKTGDGVPLYGENFNYTATVKDNGKPEENNSGLYSVSYGINDPHSVVDDVGEEITAFKDPFKQDLTIPSQFAKQGETNDAHLTIQAEDIAHNGKSIDYRFAMDNLGPRITVKYDNNEATNDKFFNKSRPMTVTVNDINFDQDQTALMIDGENLAQKLVQQADGTWKMEYEFGEGDHSFSVASTDRAKNQSGAADYTDSKAPTDFTVDFHAPEVTVTKTTKATITGSTINNEEYYNGEVTYSFEIKDQNLTNAAGQTQKLDISYTLEDGTGGNVFLPATQGAAKEGELTYQNGTYSYSFTLRDGQVLKDISMKAVDNAGNSAEKVTAIGTSFDGMQYTGGIVVVDTTKPVVTMEKTIEGGQYVQTIDGRDYYNGKVTYALTVKDKFLDDSSSEYQASLIYQKQNATDSIAVKLSPTNGAGYGGEDTLTGTVTLEDGQMLTGMTLNLTDAAGNTAKEVLITDADSKTSFMSEGAKHEYNKNSVIVDTTAPTAKLTVQGEGVESFYTHKGVAYVRLKYPTGTPNSTKEPVAVDVLLEVTDWNMSLKDGGAYQIKTNLQSDTGSWTGEAPINAENTLTYKKTLKVAVDRTDLIKLDLSVFDLAGHPLAAVDVNTINGTSPIHSPVSVDEGKVTGTITLDRRQPTSDEDFDPPKITITPVPAPKYTSRNGKDLFTGSFIYKLLVTDGSEAEWQRHAGLKSITWNVEGLKDFVTYTNCPQGDFEAGKYEYSCDINFTAQSGETNDAVMTITATDNVGNEILYKQEFAVDTLAPRVTVTYDNNDVKNDMYFNANRVATIQVEDINFDPNATKIVTQVTPSAWVEVKDDTWQCNCAYTTDGEYTLEISSEDLGKNSTPDDKVKYPDVAPKKFVIDKTLPLIDVFFHPDEPSGIDEENVSYYNQDTTATVKITELNFREGDVRATFNSEHKLSGFADNGKEHTATVTFDDGNRYQFSVNYTDLAGNPAVPYNSNTFSVDSKEPTIEITTPGMTNEALNIVPGELELQFRINDAQANLSDYKVTLYHLNNLFEERVVDGRFYDTRTEDGGSTVYVTLRDLTREKANDGLYTVRITAEDYAGNTVELSPPLVFSVNRFGSSFAMGSEYTVQFLTGDATGSVYRNAIDEPLVFQEINPNRVWNDQDKKVEGSTLTLMVNGVSRRLEKDRDYTMTVERNGEGEKTWYVYTYTINPSVFQDGNDLVNGRYTILVYGVDDAENYNTNEANSFESDDERFTGRIEFTLDTQAPVITTTGIESRKSYNAEFQQMEIFVSDATPYVLNAKLNGEPLQLQESAQGLSTADAWLAEAEEEGYFVLNVPEMNSLLGSQNVELEALDSAGNKADAEVVEFLVSSNFFVRLINNTFAMIALALAILACIFLIVFLKKKRKEKVGA